MSVFDFGSGRLDLAYEVMRGYHGLVLVDVSRQGGEPGTLYVMEMGLGLSDEVAASVDQAVKVVLEQVEELRCTSSP